MWGVPVASGVTCGGAFVTWGCLDVGATCSGLALGRLWVGRCLVPFPGRTASPWGQIRGSFHLSRVGLMTGTRCRGRAQVGGPVALAPSQTARGPGLEWAAACLPRALAPVHSGCAAGPRKAAAPGTPWREGPSALSSPHALPPTPRPRGGSLLWLQPQPPRASRPFSCSEPRRPVLPKPGPQLGRIEVMGGGRVTCLGGRGSGFRAHTSRLRPEPLPSRPGSSSFASAGFFPAGLGPPSVSLPPRRRGHRGSWTSGPPSPAPRQARREAWGSGMASLRSFRRRRFRLQAGADGE